MGLAEGIINFVKGFTDEPAEYLHTQKRRHVYLEAEPEIWWSLVVQNPHNVVTNNGKQEIEWFEEELDDASLQSILKKTYKTFKMFNGSCQHIINTFGVSHLREILKTNLPSLIAQINPEGTDFLNTLDGIQFLPVNKNVFLKIQTFLNCLEQTFDQIRYTSFMYKNQLVWSGLEQEDMKILYKFVNDARTKGIQGEFMTSPQETKKDTGVLTTSATPSFVYLGPPTNLTQYHLVIHHIADCTTILLVDYSYTKLSTFYQNVHTFIKRQLEVFVKSLEEYFNYKQQFEEDYQFIYYNRMNLALKSSLKGNMIPRDVARILARMHEDFEESKDNISEVMIRTSDDRWIVGKKSDQREFYIIFERKDANLLQVSEEIKTLSAKHFHNIFMD